MADDRMQRISIFGHYQPYRAGQSDTELGVLAASDVRGDAMDALRIIEADKQAYRAQLETDVFSTFNARYPRGIPKKTATLLRRRITEEVKAYEQARLIEWANVEIKSGAPWSRVAGIWVAS